MSERIENFRKILKEKNLNAILIKSKSNKKYLGALTGSGVKVLITEDKCYQIMDGRYENEARNTTKGFEIFVHNQAESYIDVITKILKKNSRLAVESSNTLATEYLKLKSTNLEIILLDNELEFERRSKDTEEILKVKKACDITDNVFLKIVKSISIGMTENELSALIQYLSILNGASAMAFDTIVASGERGCMPHGRPTDRAFRNGDFITIDFGVVYDGYQSDMTRTVCIGTPTEEMLKIYNIVLEAQKSGVEFIKSGIKAKEVDKHVRDIIDSYGYGEYFTHGLGHGMGLGEGEFPVLNKNSETILEEGMIMSCEPGIYIPNVGGVRIEDDVLIVDGIGEALNKTSKELIIIEVK